MFGEEEGGITTKGREKIYLEDELFYFTKGLSEIIDNIHKMSLDMCKVMNM